MTFIGVYVMDRSALASGFSILFWVCASLSGVGLGYSSFE